jgi:hypothetical protein
MSSLTGLSFMVTKVGKRLPDNSPLSKYQPGDYGKRILDHTSWVLMDPNGLVQIYASGQVIEHQDGTISVGQIHHHGQNSWCGSLTEGLWTQNRLSGPCNSPPTP